MAHAPRGQVAELKRHPPTRASLGVLCDRASLLGNPFHMKAEEQLRDTVCDAFADLMRRAEGSSGRTLGDLAMEVAVAHGLDPSRNFSKDWISDFGSRDTIDFMQALGELRDLSASARAARRTLRLYCHCAPKRCHTQSLAACVGASAGPSGRPSSHRGPREGAGFLTFACDGPASTGALYVCIVEKSNGILGFPKGGVEPKDTSTLAAAHREWLEETNLPTEGLHRLVEEPVVEEMPRGPIYYYVASWEAEWQAGSTWRVQDDPQDKNPIVKAHWMSVQNVLLSSLKRERKELLQRGMRVRQQAIAARTGSSAATASAGSTS